MPASVPQPSVINAYLGTVAPAPVYAIPSSGSPGGGVTKEQAFTTTPQAVWILNHNLGYYPTVEVLNMARQEVGAQVDHFSINQVRVSFNDPQIGYVIYS